MMKPWMPCEMIRRYFRNTNSFSESINPHYLYCVGLKMHTYVKRGEMRRHARYRSSSRLYLPVWQFSRKQKGDPVMERPYSSQMCRQLSQDGPTPCIRLGKAVSNFATIVEQRTTCTCRVSSVPFAHVARTFIPPPGLSITMATKPTLIPSQNQGNSTVR